MKKEKKPKTKTVKQKKVKPQKIKQKKVKAPKYIPVKPVFGTAEDYYIYRLNPVETATRCAIGRNRGIFLQYGIFQKCDFFPDRRAAPCCSGNPEIPGLSERQKNEKSSVPVP